MFNIALLFEEQKVMGHPLEEAVEYSEENDDVRSILAHICDSLEDMNVVKFVVNGFGQYPWPVDVRFDLPIVLEQLGQVLSSLHHGLPTQLDFPEQGLQRSLHMVPSQSTVTITCTSFGKWKPTSEVVTMDSHQLGEMLKDLAFTFLKVAKCYFPSEVSHPWFVQWEKQLL
jgi:hypothetical protein